MVMVVVAVRGRSLDMAAADEGGNFRACSNRLSRDLMSWRSSKQLDTAVDTVDSVPSKRCLSASPPAESRVGRGKGTCDGR